MTNKDRKKSEGRNTRRFPVIAAALLAVSGISAGIFGFTAEMTTRAGLNEMEKVPTSYHVPAVNSVPEMDETVTKEENRETGEAGAETGSKIDDGIADRLDYHASMSSLNTGTPTSIDLTMEEAAALGMKYLEDIMGFDKEGANVYMSYDSGTVTFPRAFWDGDVRFGEEVKTDDDTWHFFIDAVTGELFMLSCSETLDVDVPLGYDSSLENNYGVYAEAAKEIAECCNLVGGPVADVKYSCQGYSSDNNPDITMEVYGENGQIATLTFSRYNQRFLGLSTDTSRVITDRAMEDLMKEDAEATDWQTQTLEDGSVIMTRER